MKNRNLLFLWLLIVWTTGVLIACENDGDATADDDAGGADDDDNDDNDLSPPPEEYDYDVPVKATSPWPEHRRTSTHSGRSPIVPTPNDREPWFFQTAKGMFHEPILDEDGTVYIGSADTNFYAINPDGTEKWRFAMTELVDSTAVLGADGTIYVPGGDGYIHALTATGEEIWRLSALGDQGYLTWWEGHAAMGPDGRLYAGNDDRRMYCISLDGRIDWTYATGDQIWSCPAFGLNGRLFFGSNDLLFRSVTAAGKRAWRALTLGPVAGSPALSDDRATVYVGSFDGYLHAYDAATGKPRWKFAARDHFYASPAIAADGTIYIGSADGTMYAINPDGTLRWSFDTLDPIRSSAAVDGDGNLYFGCGDGKLYALRPDGKKAWSFDTTTGDRNDLNGSPAIDKQGIVIGGEAGAVVFVPFGYCDNNADSRCDTSPDEAIPDHGAFLYFYTNGGSSVAEIETAPAPTEVLTFRLVVRKNGETVRARVKSSTLDLTLTPNVAHRVEVSADGNFLSVIPEEPLPLNTAMTVAISGQYLTGGWRLGNRLFGGEVGGSFQRTFTFSTAAPTGHPLPLTVTEDQATTLLLRRMAAPQPPMLTTFNQIGFDSYNFLLGTVAIDPARKKAILLTVEGTPGLSPHVNVDTKSIFGLNGEYRDSYFAFGGEGFRLDITGVSIAMDLFRLSGLLAPDLTADNLNIYDEVTCAEIEFFGFALNLLGLCSPDSGKMIVNGTALLAPQTGGEGLRPAGLAIDELTYHATGGTLGGGYLEASFQPNDLPAAEQLPVILVVDDENFAAIDLQYGTNLEKSATGTGKLDGVRLNLPPGFDPTGKSAYVIVNLYPLYSAALPPQAGGDR
ncbi:MAG: PQQ-like beta-propeller repeat protein [Myxococcales bacterium]|nr:PQQ-like beta-propeller repeat protein [Myxococcales bacterium]